MSRFATTVPVYASYDLAKAFAVYTAPKYVLRYAASAIVRDEEDGIRIYARETV